MSESTTFIDLLVEHENVIADLYTFFAGHFPDDKRFWQDLADMEQEHAQQWALMKANPEYEKVNIDNVEKQKLLLTNSIKFIRKQKERFEKNSRLKIKDAYHLGSLIEHSFFEKEIFKLIESEDEEIKGTIDEIYTDTQVHYRTFVKRQLLK